MACFSDIVGWRSVGVLRIDCRFQRPNGTENKKAVLPQGNRAMPQVFFSVEVRQQHSLQV